MGSGRKLTAIVAATGWAEAVCDVGVALGGAELAGLVLCETGVLDGRVT